MSRYADIIARLEKATWPDRGIDGAICAELFGNETYIIGHEEGNFPQQPIFGTKREAFSIIKNNADGADYINAERYTASIDAAIALVERMLPSAQIGIYVNNLTSHPKGEGARVFIRRGKGPKCPHTGIRWPRTAGECFYAPTAPLSILLALFKALQAMEEV